tara:strand:+ start:591 stop:860 length:270 start_codon:yes stop_codon:yes gene_type:complete
LKRINKQHHSKQKEFVCSTNAIRNPGKLYYINKDGNLIETIMGHRNPNHTGTLVAELNIEREEGYLYFCLDDKNKDKKIDIYRVQLNER